MAAKPVFLRDVEVGPVWDAAGARNYFGEGYPHHKLTRPNFEGSTFVTKTFTLNGNRGYMPLKDDGRTPKEHVPRCIVPNMNCFVRPLLHQVTLNSVGLSGKSLKDYLDEGVLQYRDGAWMISVMSIKGTMKERVEELRQIVALLRQLLVESVGKIVVQLNVSCPNVGLKRDYDTFLTEVDQMVRLLVLLGIPIVIKIVCLTPVDIAMQIAELPGVDAICTTNTLPWGSYPDRIDWHRLFGTGGVSPLAGLDPSAFNPRRGGLSGPPLLQINARFITELRKRGCTKHINASGGVMDRYAVYTYKDAGASSIAIGSVAIHRPHKIQRIIRIGHRLFGSAA